MTTANKSTMTRRDLLKTTGAVACASALPVSPAFATTDPNALMARMIGAIKRATAHLPDSVFGHVSEYPTRTVLDVASRMAGNMTVGDACRFYREVLAANGAEHDSLDVDIALTTLFGIEDFIIEAPSYCPTSAVARAVWVADMDNDCGGLADDKYERITRSIADEFQRTVAEGSGWRNTDAETTLAGWWKAHRDEYQDGTPATGDVA